MLKLKLLDHSPRLIQVYDTNSSAQHPEFVKKTILMPCEGLKLTNERCFGRLNYTRWEQCCGMEGCDRPTW